MGLTMKDILKIDAMETARIIAGKEGLDREIVWVTVIEVLDEIHLLQKGELLITTAFGLTDTPRLAEELIPRLVERKLAGLAIQTGYYLNEIPDLIIRQCDRYHFPLIELPKPLKFSELTMAITKRIINRQMETLEYAQRIHERLTQVLLQNQGLPQIAAVLSDLLASPVRILDAHFVLLASAGLAESSRYLEAAALREELLALSAVRLPNTEQPLVRVFARDTPETPDQFLHALVAGRDVYGYISVLSGKPVLEDMEKIAIASAATISTLETLKDMAVWEAEERVKGDFIDDLLENNILTDTILRRRANYLGFNLNSKFVVLTVQFVSLHSRSQQVSEEVFQETKNRLFSLVRFFLHSQQQQALLKYKNNNLAVLLQIEPETTAAEEKAALTKLAQSLRRQVTAEASATISVGIGRVYKNLPDMSRSLQEAEQALQIGQQLHKQGFVLMYEDLGPYSLFAGKINEMGLLDYYERSVAGLIDYDSRHKRELIPTLESFIQCNNGLKETADALFIHRHTLKYRLQRIREISGFDPENSRDLFQLQLGLVLARLLAKI